MFWPEVVALIRRSRMLALATNSVQMAGYPHVSWLPTVADEAGRPMLVISRLAEHTHNLQQDQRVSVLLHDDEMSLNKARLTIWGDLQPASLDELLAARWARYNPELASCLQMSDFSVWRLWPRRARYIAGFGQMGWVEGDAWESAPALTLEQEAQLLAEYTPMQAQALVGIDLGGCDVWRDGRVQRYEFAAPASDLVELKLALEQLLQGI
ncbi:pyridoxamine 5'-phosphate oxidase family protein [Chitinibacter fontanus]|uniref:Pyridoxamine 5'-phosphate oxidase family protein n=1 Tax=Chitinibacter fontanus TaxID=1737446 RepID=A0A7D5Z4R2_9NEIS|nr:pyridoxamine 5'-phosphate oxidase family protein [Chitinibacter fontanus]QLI81103.1 pyridoxamine 5'-phosphate oxidase family protein [Chitinibacter fontanus]